MQWSLISISYILENKRVPSMVLNLTNRPYSTFKVKNKSFEREIGGFLSLPFGHMKE